MLKGIIKSGQHRFKMRQVLKFNDLEAYVSFKSDHVFFTVIVAGFELLKLYKNIYELSIYKSGK